MTKFDKKYNSKDKETEIRLFWEKNNIFEFDKETKKPIFSIDTPPPTISGKMHIGHAFSYTQQDFIVRYKRMSGNEVYFPFGTDDNGLPTENLVQKEKKVNLRKIPRNEAIKIVLDFLKEERPKFIQDWKNLGMSCDFNLSYSTIDDFSRKISQESFLELIEKGLIERRKGPVMWDRVFQTSIAQVELEDKTKKGFLNYVKAPILNSEKTFLIYATTRPELCFAVIGISIEEKGKYVKLKVGNEFWITGKETLNEKFEEFDYEIVEELNGRDLIGEKVKIPIVEKEIEISQDLAVKADFGTGIAYFCTYGGQEDIEWSKRHRIEPIEILEKNGKLTNLAKDYSGMLCEEARKKIIIDMEEKNHIIKKELKEQIVNVGERSGSEIEYIVSNQWFVNYLDKKEYFFEMAQKFNWTPEFMKIRIENWIKGLNWDWGFSRQRYFGIPIPVWYGKKTGRKYFAHKSQLPIDPTIDKPKLTKKIYFVRHGEYENNLLKKSNIDKNNKINLTEKGNIQAKNLGKKLAGIKFDRVITSEFERCFQTAKNILKNNLDYKKNNPENLIIEKNTILNELKIGNEGDSYDKIDKKIKEQIFNNNISNEDTDIKENLELLNKFFNNLKLSKYDNEENILIVTHKDTLRLLKIIVENLNLNNFYNFDFKNCEYFLFEKEIEINEELIGDPDILDTWFTSSSSPIIASKLLGEDTFKKVFPMNLRPQAHDIIGNWLFYTMAKTNLLYDINPFNDVIISGFVLSSKGEKMSKSKGNGISPQTIVEKYSNDALRFAAASTKLGQDIPFQEKEVQTGIKLVNKIYNATKFTNMLLSNFNKNEKKIINYAELKSIDKWILAKLQDTIKNSTNSFEKYDYSKSKSEFDNFFMKNIADNYIEIVKERLWKPERFGIEETKKAQKALYYSLYNSIKGLSPFIPFICEEVYQKFFSNYENEKSIHLTSWPIENKEFLNENLIILGDKFVNIISSVRKFKSENKLSMKNKLKEIIINCDNNLKEFIEDSIEDFKAVTSIEKITFNIIDTKNLNNEIKIKILKE